MSISGQKWSNFETQNLLFKIYPAFPVLSQDSKECRSKECFVVRQLEMPEMACQKSDVITFTWLLGHCTAKNEDIGLKFCTLAFAI